MLAKTHTLLNQADQNTFSQTTEKGLSMSGTASCCEHSAKIPCLTLTFPATLLFSYSNEYYMCSCRKRTSDNDFSTMEQQEVIVFIIHYSAG